MRSDAENAWHRAWGKRNREKTRLYNKRYRMKKPDLVRQWNRKAQARLRAVDPDHRRRRCLQERYGLTIEAWDSMFFKQGGVCAICKRQSKKGGLVVDHDHKTGLVRGLLCHNCNLTLGKFEDRPEWFEMAASYLRRINATQT